MSVQTVAAEYTDLLRRFGLVDGGRFIYQTFRGKPDLVKVPTPPIEHFSINEYALRHHVLESTDKIEALVNSIPLKRDEVSHVVDLGANVGLFSLLCREAYPFGTIRAVEPHPICVKALQANLSMDDSVSILPEAVVHPDNDVGTTDLHVFDNSSQTSSVQMNAALKDRPTRTVEVDTTTLSEVVEGWDTVDVLKLDIQGLEYEVLKEFPEIIDNTRVLLAEVSFLDESPHQLLDLLTDSFNNYEPVSPVNYGADMVFY